MGYLAAWYHERPRLVEAVQLGGPSSIEDLASFMGARSWHETDVDIEFFDTPQGTVLVPWGDWVVRLHALNFEVVPAPLFSLVYEPSVL